jgi:accessory gene regulator protein AgrB
MQLSYMVLRVENLFSKHNEENLQCVLLAAVFFPLPDTSFGESCQGLFLFIVFLLLYYQQEYLTYEC